MPLFFACLDSIWVTYNAENPDAESSRCRGLQLRLGGSGATERPSQPGGPHSHTTPASPPPAPLPAASHHGHVSSLNKVPETQTQLAAPSHAPAASVLTALLVGWRNSTAVHQNPNPIGLLFLWEERQ